MGPGASAQPGGRASAPPPVGHQVRGLVAIEGGTAHVGSADPDHPEEWPVRAVELAAYVSSEPGPGGEPLYEWIDVREVMWERPQAADAA